MPGRLYDADIYRFGEVPQHYWASTAGPCPEDAERRLDRDVAADVAVIGGGYTGLAAARRLAGRHGASVCVLEAATRIGWGASGANAGFVSMGGTKLSIGEMVRTVGEAETRRYWSTQMEAVRDLAGFIGDRADKCGAVGDGNLCVAHHPGAAAELTEEADTLSKRFGVTAEFLDAERFRQEAHVGPETFGGLLMRPGFALNPMQLVFALAHAATERGARIFTGAEVVSWHQEGPRHILTTASGLRVTASRVVVATNGYTPNGIRRSIDFRTLPAISSIVVTQAYGGAELDARGFRSCTPIYSSRNLIVYYRRLPDGRVLFGQRGDTRGTAAAARDQSISTVGTLRRILPSLRDAQVDFAWRGLVCLTARRSLAVGTDPDDPHVAFAFGCHGSGVAAMNWAGKLAADMVVGAATEQDVPALFRGLPQRLPSSNMVLRWGLRGAYAYYALRDALHV